MFQSLFKQPLDDQPQEPPALLDKPWRELRWGKVQEDRQYVQEYKPAQDNIRYLRVLLYGPVGHGRSSFINSVSNVIRERISIPAFACTAFSCQYFTKVFETHRLIKGRGNAKTIYPVVFNDMMGVEEGNNRGVHEDDIKLALKGHVKEGHKFNQVSPLVEGHPDYNPNPSADDKVHVLVCVLSANSSLLKPSVLEKLKNVRERASDLGIPQMVIMTHIDEACGETEKDLRNVYKSRFVKKRMKDFSAAVGIPMNCVFPVKNYTEEIDLKDDVDTLILSALRKMIDFGDDFIERM